MKRALSLVLGCWPLLAAADIYRWVDADGQIHFSQNPPVTGAYQNVTPSGTAVLRAPAPPRAGSDSQTLTTQPELKARADRAERCAKAHERINFLEEKTAHRLFRTGDDGQPARLTEEEFDQQLTDARAAAAKYCE